MMALMKPSGTNSNGGVPTKSDKPYMFTKAAANNRLGDSNEKAKNSPGFLMKKKNAN
jgi:hypothetical protein